MSTLCNQAVNGLEIAYTLIDLVSIQLVDVHISYASEKSLVGNTASLPESPNLTRTRWINS